MLFSPLPKCISEIQSEELTAQYQEEIEFLLKLKMLPSLAYVPEQDVDCFNILLADFPESALSVTRYFDETHIGKQLLDQSRIVPQFPIRIWKMYERVRGQLARTNNAVEGCHNAFPSNIACSYPTLCKAFNVLQREQSFRKQR